MQQSQQDGEFDIEEAPVYAVRESTMYAFPDPHATAQESPPLQSTVSDVGSFVFVEREGHDDNGGGRQIERSTSQQFTSFEAPDWNEESSRLRPTGRPGLVVDVAANAMQHVTRLAQHGSALVKKIIQPDGFAAEDTFAALNERLSVNDSLFRRFSYFVFDHAASTLPLWIALAALEATLLAVYIAQSERMFGGASWNMYDADERGTLFIARVTLSFLSLMTMSFIFALDQMAAAALVSTTLYQLGVFFASIAFPSKSQLYVPFFLRCWTLRAYLLFILDGIRVVSRRHPVLDATRSIADPVLQFLALLVTFTGIFRINEVFQGNEISFVESFYCMIVTCTTVGYGDVTPATKSGKTLIMLFIFAFVAELPQVLAHLSALATYLNSVAGYTGGARHVVVVGTPTYKEIVTLLSEFTSFSANRTVVFVSTAEISTRMRDLEANPLYRNRVAFVHVDYMRDPLLLERAKVPQADALIVLSDKHSRCAHGDYNAMMTSRLFDRFAPKVPQLLWLRFGTHTSLIPEHHTVVVTDVLKKAILATALLMPGVIPFLVNLVRLAGSKGATDEAVWTAERSGDWKEQYRFSRRHSMHRCSPRKWMVGLPLRSVVRLLFRRRLLLVGVVSDENHVLLDLERVIDEGTTPTLLIVCEKSEAKSVASTLDDMEEKGETKLRKQGTRRGRAERSPATPAGRSNAAATGSGDRGGGGAEYRVGSIAAAPSTEMMMDDGGEVDEGSGMGMVPDDSFYPFERTLSAAAPPGQGSAPHSPRHDEARPDFAASLTMSSGGANTSFVDIAVALKARYPFLDPTPCGVELSQLDLDPSERAVVTALLSHYDALEGRGASALALERTQQEVNALFQAMAQSYLKRQLEMLSQRKAECRRAAERFVFIDQATTISIEKDQSEYDVDLSRRMIEQSLVVMMQCLRSIYPNVSATLLSLNPLSTKFRRDWHSRFGSSLRFVKGQGTLLSHVEHALRVHQSHTNVRGVLIFSSQMGRREYEDVPILTVEKNVKALMQSAEERHVMEPFQERHVIVELKTFTSAPFCQPQHHDAEWSRQGEERFQHTLPFMAGKCFSSDMLQTVLTHSFYLPEILRWFSLILNVAMVDAEVMDFASFDRTSPGGAHRTSTPSNNAAGGGGEGGHSYPSTGRSRFKFYGNHSMKLQTFGDAFELLLSCKKSISIGVFRRFPEEAHLAGTPRYFITNPPPEMPLQTQDIVYALYAGSMTEVCSSPAANQVRREPDKNADRGASQSSVGAASAEQPPGQRTCPSSEAGEGGSHLSPVSTNTEVEGRSRHLEPAEIFETT